jgi:hypothetical protein
MFKQVTSPNSGVGVNALGGVDWHEFPAPHLDLPWKKRASIAAKNLYSAKELGSLNSAGQLVQIEKEKYQ